MIHPKQIVRYCLYFSFSIQPFDLGSEAKMPPLGTASIGTGMCPG